MKTLTRIVLFWAMPAVLTAQAVEIVLPETTAVRGQAFSMPIHVASSLTGKNVTAYQLQVRYNPAVVSFDSVLTAGTMTGAAGFSVTVNKPANNIINIAAAGVTPMTGLGVLVNMKFTLHHSGYSEMTFTDAAHNFFNEGNPAVTLDNGYVSVNEPPALFLYPNDVILAVGEQVQFNAQNGPPPYHWSVTNPSVASIDTLGKLTALIAGFTRVAVSNDGGLVDTIDNPVEVRSSQMWMRDTTLFANQTFDLPVYTSNLTGLNYSAVHIIITYNAVSLTALGVTTNGTMLNGRPAPTVNLNKSGTIDIGFADASPLTGSGIFFALHLQGKSAGYSTMTFATVLFNETAKAKTVNGNVNTQALSSLNVSPQTANVIVADTLQFSVNNGAGTLQWSTSDSTVAVMTASGKLIALKSGSIKVRAQDSLAAVGFSDLIRVYDARVGVGTVYAAQNAVVDVPMRITRFNPAQPASSFQLKIEYDSSAMDYQSLENGGTLTQGWSVLPSRVGNAITVAAASASNIQTPGTLFFLRFKMRANLAPVTGTTVFLRQFMFNEGSPSSIGQDGSVTVVNAPTTPSLYLPGNGATNLQSSVSLQWFETQYTEQYWVQVSTNSGFTNIVREDSSRTTASWQITGLDSTTTYYWRVQSINTVGASGWSNTFSFTTGVFVGVNDPTEVPQQFGLLQNYPNPFNPATNFEFRIANFELVRLRVYDILGRQVASLIDETLAAGEHRATWNAGGMPTGLYIARLESGGKSQTQKLLLVK